MGFEVLEVGSARRSLLEWQLARVQESVIQ